MVMELQNLRSCSANWVLGETQALEKHDAFVEIINHILQFLQTLYTMETVPNFVLAISQKPLQVIRLDANRFAIVVSEDCIYHLLSLCNRLQSYPPISTFLGLKSVPPVVDYRDKTLIDITRNIIYAPQSPLEIGGTHDITVFRAALFFLLAHEFAHIAHGHLDFKESSDFKSFCKGKEDEAYTLRTMEMDADCSAVSMLYGFFNSIVHEYDHTPRGNMTLDQVRTLMFHRHLTGMFFCILYTDTITENFFPVNHPINYARYITAVEIMEILLTTRQPDFVGSTEKIRKKIVDLFTELSGDASKLHHPLASNTVVWEAGSTAPHSFYSEVTNLLVKEHHLEPLHSRWAEIRPYLQNYLRGGQLAPAR
jgi:hypothetical protein